MAGIPEAIPIKEKDHLQKSGRAHLSLFPAFPSVLLSVGDLVSKVGPNPCVVHWVRMHKTSTVVQLSPQARPRVRTGETLKPAPR